MSHEIDQSTGRAAFAYATGTDAAWHGLGSDVDPNAPITDWQVAAGLNFRVVHGELLYRDAAGVIHSAGKALNRSVLYRDDTGAPLSVMSCNRYKVHQPIDILQFVKDVSDTMGWPVNTAGALYNGRKIWALLKLPESFTLPGGDKVGGHLLSTGCFDGSGGSEFRFVAERVVCRNTMQMALNEKGATVRAVQYHTEAFDASKIKSALGVYESAWARYIETAKSLVAVKLTHDKAVKILRQVYDDVIEGESERVTDEQFFLDNPTPRRILGLYEGAGLGSSLASALDTGWGLVNAVTQDVDHYGSNRNSRLNSAWFGQGALRKAAIVDAVLAA